MGRSGTAEAALEAWIAEYGDAAAMTQPESAFGRLFLSQWRLD